MLYILKYSKLHSTNAHFYNPYYIAALVTSHTLIEQRVTNYDHIEYILAIYNTMPKQKHRYKRLKAKMYHNFYTR